VNFEEDAPGRFLTDIDFAILEYDAKGKVLAKSAVLRCSSGMQIGIELGQLQEEVCRSV
jgi:hypothetical protein